MKILIVDDHPVVRQGIRQILARHAPVESINEAATAAAAMESLATMPVDLVLLDLNLPDNSGFWVLKEIRRCYPDLPVLVLTIQSEENTAVRVLKAGANGFLNKESAPEELLNAVQSVLGGRRYISTRLAEWLAFDVSGHRESVPHERLSDREFQVLCLLGTGKSITDIAQMLSCSPTTISTYRKRIFPKMNMESNADLTMYCLKHRLISM
jgi:DNA-binding NarL/FixJ family response regulator